MKYLSIIVLALALTGCGGTSSVPMGNSGLFCVSVEAAALLQFISSTTLFEGVVGPTDADGNPMMETDELIEALEKCFSDPQSQVLLEALRAQNPSPEDG